LNSGTGTWRSSYKNKIINNLRDLISVAFTGNILEKDLRDIFPEWLPDMNPAARLKRQVPDAVDLKPEIA
jgi:hypothetical protein